MDTIQLLRKQSGVLGIQKSTCNFDEFGEMYVKIYHRNLVMVEREQWCENLDLSVVYSALRNHPKIARHLLRKNTKAFSCMLYTWRKTSEVHLYVEIETKWHFKRIYHVVL